MSNIWDLIHEITKVIVTITPQLFLSELQSTTYRLTVINKYGINIMDD